MRSGLLAAILAPLLVNAVASLSEHSVHDGPHVDATVPSIDPESGSNGSPVEFKLSLPGGDDSLLFSFQVRHPQQEQIICGHPQVVVNGFDLIHNGSEDASHSHLITAQRSSDNATRSLSVQSSGNCLWKGSPPEHSDSLEVYSLRVEYLDSVEPETPVGFSAILNQHDRSVLRVLGSDSISSDPTSPPKLNVSPLVTFEHHNEDNFRTSIEEEVTKLHLLLGHFKSKDTPTDANTNSTTDEIAAEFHGFEQEIKSCDSVKCVFHVIFEKTKTCFHILHEKFHRHKHPKDIGKARCRMPLTPVDPKVFMANPNPCTVPDYSGKYEQHSYQPLPSHASKDDDDSSSSSSSSSDSSEDGFTFGKFKDHGPRHKVHVLIGVVAGLFCLTCFTTCLHRRCCSPRARADRLARREERRTAREYRRLARRQVWRDRWNRFSGRLCGNWTSQQPRSGNYEEKRTLILSQEAILEEAMQSQIRRLERAAGIRGDAVNAAEEGRAPVSRTMTRETSLPGYRSRSGSGRPPSYTSVDPHPDALADELSELFAVGDYSDATPDSSVAAVSPRISSETLRTERSIT